MHKGKFFYYKQPKILLTIQCLYSRYYLVLRTGLDARASGDITDFQRLYQQQSDLCMLHLFDSFMESAPQLILQLYVMITMGDWHSWTGGKTLLNIQSSSGLIFDRF